MQEYQTGKKSCFKLSNWISEVDLGKTLELCYMFLPHNIPISAQIFNVFEKTQSMANQSIPEDTELEMKVKLVKPLKGGPRSTFFIPLIRENSKKLHFEFLKIDLF